MFNHFGRLFLLFMLMFKHVPRLETFGRMRLAAKLKVWFSFAPFGTFGREEIQKYSGITWNPSRLSFASVWMTCSFGNIGAQNKITKTRFMVGQSCLPN
jgi:hypothetical protein